jgi:anti-sigma factor RsiW
MTNELSNVNGRHWSSEELVDHFYGLDPAEGLEVSHLESCERCSARLASIQQLRRESAAPRTVSEDLLRRQRNAVFARLERPARRSALWGLAPAAATALLVVMGVMLQPTRPVENVQTAAITASDRELLNEVSAMLNDDAPRGAAPIKALFAEQSEGEAQ